MTRNRKAALLTVIASLLIPLIMYGCAIFSDRGIHYLPTQPPTDTTKVHQ